MYKKIIGIFIMTMLIATSLPVVSYILNNQVTVTITSPNDGDVLSGKVTITADANADLGVSMVQFEIEGDDYSDSGFDGTSPYEYSWSTPSDTNGYFVITATAYDNGGSFTSHRIIVYLNNVDKFAFSGAGDFLNNGATSDEITTSAGFLLSLKLWNKYDIDSGDVGEIYVKEAGTSSWTIIKSPVYGHIADWTSESIGIPSQFWGKNIVIGFRFDTGSDSTSKGWSILGFVIEEQMIDEPLNIIYSENFKDYDIGDSWGDWVIVDENGEDNTPPLTLLSVYGEIYGEEPEYWLTPETILSFTASDEVSGVNTTYYRIWYLDIWSDWMEWEGESFNLSDDGLHYLEWYSVDYANNVEDTNNFSLYVDGLPPYIYLSTDGSKHVGDFAFICAPWDKNASGGIVNDWVIQGLYAYFVLIDKGYKPDHIVLILANDRKQIDIDTIINTLNTSDKFSTKGKINDTMIINMKKNLVNKTKYTESLDWLQITNKELLNLRDTIIKYFDGKKGKTKVIFYFVGHGNIDGCFTFPDTNKDDLKTIQPEYFWTDSQGFGNLHSIYDGFEVELNKRDIVCEKIVCLFDFCYSGYFVEKLNIEDSRMKNKIAVSSSANYTTSTYITNIGSLFFNPFWRSLHAGKSISDAYNAGNKAIGKKQKPQIKPKNSKFVLFKSDPITPQTRIILEGCDDIYFSIQDVEDDIYVQPVGLNYIKYKIDGGNWIIYEEPFNIGPEGIHTLECYSADLLSNTGEIDEYSVIVDDTSPNSPDLLSPNDYEISCTTTPNFDWTSIDDVSDVYYTLQISTDALFSNIVYEHVDIIGSYYSVKNTEKLELGSYFWRVCAIDGVDHNSPWSETWSFTAPKENNAPEKPDKPEGTKSGKPGEKYTYSTVTNDVDGDKIKYIFDWGDGKYDITFSYDSGKTINCSHIWVEDGDYSIKIKVIDEHGYESEWSDPLVVSMPKIKIYNSVIQLLIKLFGRFPFLEKILNQ